jgi:ribosomal protein S18 acetylase RimI-like enzyme
VIADSVNPIQLSRDAWIGVAHRAGVRAVEVEVICSDPQLHRQRVETRSSDIRGLALPTWEKVISREYEPWQREHIILDTAGRSVAVCVAELRAALPKVNGAIHFFTPTKDFGPALGLMARQAFSDAFAHLYDPVPFMQFLEEAYGPGGRMERDLAEPSIRWRVAAIDGRPIGYAKLSSLAAPAPAPQPGAMELQQIYVLGPWHGRGVAEDLMNWAVDTARADAAPEIYLTVFDHNLRAKRFYTRHGFSEVGHCTFKLGDRVDDDRVWRKPISPTASPGN